MFLSQNYIAGQEVRVLQIEDQVIKVNLSVNLQVIKAGCMAMLNNSNNSALTSQFTQ